MFSKGYMFDPSLGKIPIFVKKSTSFQEDGRSYCKLVFVSGDFFPDSTMVNHHVSPPCGEYVLYFQTTQQAKSET